MARLETLLVSTRNRNKLEELASLLQGSLPDLELLSAADAKLADVEETGTTLEDNALLKAAAGYLASGLPTLADDTGLCVDALGGRPGVYSARYAGPSATYEDNWRKLLSELKGRPRAERGASFRCCLALVLDAKLVPAGTQGLVARPDVPDGAALVAVQGRVDGWITETPVGAGGFGYDPVFYSDEAGATFAAMDAEVKNRISHRGRAYVAIAEVLKTLKRDGLA